MSMDAAPVVVESVAPVMGDSVVVDTVVVVSGSVDSAVVDPT